jgi:hypothetical protein
VADLFPNMVEIDRHLTESDVLLTAGFGEASGAVRVLSFLRLLVGYLPNLVVVQTYLVITHYGLVLLLGTAIAAAAETTIAMPAAFPSKTQPAKRRN